MTQGRMAALAAAGQRPQTSDVLGMAMPFPPTTTRAGTVAQRRRDEAGDKARGERAREIRSLIDVSQWDLVPMLNNTAKALGLAPRYKYYTVSRIESRGTLSFEDAAVYVALDPQQRGWDWFVLGRGGVAKADPATFRKVAGRGGRK